MNPLTIGAVIGVSAAAFFALDASASAPLTVPETDPWNPPIDYGPDLSGNLDAFLQLIKIGESNDEYRALVGGGIFSDFSHHPGWADNRMSQKSTWQGWNNSHAAGAYQFQPQTFKEASDALGLGGDFSPTSQDSAAVFLLQRRGAYEYVISGDIVTAVERLRKEWDFFNSPRWELDKVISTFESYGGVLS